MHAAARNSKKVDYLGSISGANLKDPDLKLLIVNF